MNFVSSRERVTLILVKTFKWLWNLVHFNHKLNRFFDKHYCFFYLVNGLSYKLQLSNHEILWGIVRWFLYMSNLNREIDVKTTPLILLSYLHFCFWNHKWVSWSYFCFGLTSLDNVSIRFKLFHNYRLSSYILIKIYQTVIIVKQTIYIYMTTYQRKKIMSR